MKVVACLVLHNIFLELSRIIDVDEERALSVNDVRIANSPTSLPNSQVIAKQKRDELAAFFL